jgi:hypothetical protein
MTVNVTRNLTGAIIAVAIQIPSCAGPAKPLSWSNIQHHLMIWAEIAAEIGG